MIKNSIFLKKFSTALLSLMMVGIASPKSASSMMEGDEDKKDMSPHSVTRKLIHIAKAKDIPLEDVNWVEKRSNNKDPKADYVLSLLFKDGRGVSKNIEEGKELLEAARKHSLNTTELENFIKELEKEEYLSSPKDKEGMEPSTTLNTSKLEDYPIINQAPPRIVEKNKQESQIPVNSSTLPSNTNEEEKQPGVHINLPHNISSILPLEGNEKLQNVVFSGLNFLAQKLNFTVPPQGNRTNENNKWGRHLEEMRKNQIIYGKDKRDARLKKRGITLKSQEEELKILNENGYTYDYKKHILEPLKK